MESKVGIDWDAVKNLMQSQEWEERLYDPDCEERRLFLGTVFALYPSGKFYTPWANSNVLICKKCAEAGHVPCDEDSPCSGKDQYGDEIEGDHCEACADARYTENLESEAEEHGYFIEGGEGDPCDIFIVESREKEEE